MQITDLKNSLNKLGIKPNRYRGQNFVIDEETLNLIIDTARIKPRDRVVEIGPGLGALTSALLKSGADVLAIEKERAFGEYLRKKLKGEKLDVIIDNAIFAIPRLNLPEDYKVVANLPYSITSPVINLFLTGPQGKPSEMTLMVQKEVAERLTAPPGSSNRGILTVLVELLGRAQYIKTIPENVFYPAPKVKSAIIRIEISHSPTRPQKIEEVIKLVKRGFSKKRAKLKNALNGKIENHASLFESAGVDVNKRAEDITAKEWQYLAQIEADKGKS